jgi:hypothetical protein
MNRNTEVLITEDLKKDSKINKNGKLLADFMCAAKGTALSVDDSAYVAPRRERPF